MAVCVVSLDSLYRWQLQVSVYCARRILAHLRCTQCSILLHLIDICFLTSICLWQISQIQTCLRVVLGPGLVSTSPAFMRCIASHPAGQHGRLAPKTVIGPPLLGAGVVDTMWTGFARPLWQLHRVKAVSFGAQTHSSFSISFKKSILKNMTISISGLRVLGSLKNVNNPSTHKYV